MLTKHIFGKVIQFHHERGAYIPELATLIVTDTHFGKANTFKSNGLLIPEGISDSDIARLSNLIDKTNPDRIIFLGDLIHAKDSRSSSLADKLLSFRNKYSKIEFILVEGNHDKSAGVTFTELGFNLITERYETEEFVFLHKPEIIDNKYVFAGHIHPGYSVKDVIRSKITIPCFHITDNYTVLPAFSEFTGKYKIKKDKKDSIIIILEEQLLEV